MATSVKFYVAGNRPGSRPRRHATTAVRLLARLSRSTKAGVETPATQATSSAVLPVAGAQRRPGSRPRRHGPMRNEIGWRIYPLNEGRGRDPGDTRATSPGDGTVMPAQRRPGSRPRRHMPYSPLCLHYVSLRSTKAGVETPATRCGEAGYHGLAARSTKAGVETPATQTGDPRCPRPRRSLNQGRGRDPGDTSAGRSAGRSVDPLNEGRGRDPGDTTETADNDDGLWEAAQRRPGSRPRRHKSPDPLGGP